MLGLGHLFVEVEQEVEFDHRPKLTVVVIIGSPKAFLQSKDWLEFALASHVEQDLDVVHEALGVEETRLTVVFVDELDEFGHLLVALFEVEEGTELLGDAQIIVIRNLGI
jgi:hypothetical protein